MFTHDLLFFAFGLILEEDMLVLAFDSVIFMSVIEWILVIIIIL